MKLARLIKMCLNDTYGKIHISKYLSDTFPIQNGIKQGVALSPLLFNFPLEYTIRKVQENQVGLKLNGTHQLLGYADDVNLLGDNIDTTKKNTQTLTFSVRSAPFGTLVWPKCRSTPICAVGHLTLLVEARAHSAFRSNRSAYIFSFK
jgi:hypothetical protein